MSGPVGSSQWLYNADTSYSIDYSCRFNKADTAHLKRTMSTPTSAKKFSLSFWFKKPSTVPVQMQFMAMGVSGSDYAELSIVTGEYIQMFDYHAGYVFYHRNTHYLLRDPSAWMHFMVAIDTTQATEASRVRWYINGVENTTFMSGSEPTQNVDLYWWNSAVEWTIGAQFDESGNPFDGYLAEMHYVDGTQLAPTEFGEFGDYGEWKPIEASGLTYGNNGFYLDFADSAALGNDVSGNNNDWTVSGLAATDQVLDTPTNNFCTLNHNQKYVRTTYPVEGALKTVCGSTETSAPHGIPGTIAAPNSGKWYWEVAIGDGLNSKYARIGAADLDQDLVRDITRGINSASLPWIYAGAWGLDCQNGTKLSSAGAESYGSGTSDGANIMGIALDRDNGKIWFADNGTWIASGDPAAGTNFAFDSVTTGHIVPYVNTQDGAAGFITCNFGQDSSFAGLKTAQGNSDGGGVGDFYYTPPTGFLALCTKNLPDVAVIPSEHFNTVLYTGTGSSNAITGVGFQPEMTWISERDESEAVASVDILRGDTVEINISSTAAEADDAQKVTAIGSDGFTVGTSPAANQSSSAHVSYHWKAGGTGVANTAGTNNSTVSANVDAGFSIVTYTGSSGPDTVGHGLSKAPEMVATKNRTTAGNEWWIYHHENTADPETEYIRMFDTDGATADYLSWNDTAPTSTVFTVGDYRPNNGSWGDSYVAYCWHSVEGFSKVGRLIGSSLANGPFVYTGFKPMFVFMKNTQVNREPVIFDSKREPYGQMFEGMSSRGYAETTSYGQIDFLSNGFKIRENNYHINEDDRTILYLAFAEVPFKYANAR